MKDEDVLRAWIAQCLCAKTCKPFPALSALAPDNVNSLILKEGIAALLSRHIREHKLGMLVPASMLDFLDDIEKKTIAIELYRKGLNLHFYKKLSNANIDFIVLKGEALAHRLYPESYLRSRCDADLLFRSEEASNEAWKILKAEGYQKANTLQGKFVGYQFNCSKKLGEGLSNDLDIHHKISDYLWLANKLPFEELYAEAEDLKIGDQTVQTTGTVHSLLHNCIHRASNLTLNQENRLIWLYDIHLLCGQLSEYEWSRLVELAKGKSLAFIVYEGLRTSQEMYQTEIPDEVSSSLRDAGNKEDHPFGKTRKRWRLYLYDFIQNKGVLNKACQIREHLLPRTEYIETKYPKATKLTLPYYYMKRLFSGLGKYF